MRKVMYKYGFLFFFVVSLGAQDLTQEEILTYVASHPKPESSITEIRLEVKRKKKKKKKVKVREFTRYEKLYTSGKFTSKSLARFHKPKIVKGTSFLSWVYKNGKTDQWFALPKIKKAKKVKPARLLVCYMPLASCGRARRWSSPLTLPRARVSALKVTPRKHACQRCQRARSAARLKPGEHHCIGACLCFA